MKNEDLGSRRDEQASPAGPTAAESRELTPQAAKRKEARLFQIMNRCAHFTGIQHDTCQAGISYATVKTAKTDTEPFRFACFANESHGLTCAAAKFPTRAEAETEHVADEAQMARFSLAHRKAHDDAKAKGYAKNHGGVSQCVCPVCNGTLRYSVASYNGHMHGKCETEGCVSWME